MAAEKAAEKVEKAAEVAKKKIAVKNAVDAMKEADTEVSTAVEERKRLEEKSAAEGEEMKSADVQLQKAINLKNESNENLVKIKKKYATNTAESIKANAAYEESVKQFEEAGKQFEEAKKSNEEANKELEEAKKVEEEALKKRAEIQEQLEKLNEQLAELEAIDIDDDTDEEEKRLLAQLSALDLALDTLEALANQLLYARLYRKGLENNIENLLDNKPPSRELLLTPTVFFTCSENGLGKTENWVANKSLDMAIRWGLTLTPLAPVWAPCVFQGAPDHPEIPAVKDWVSTGRHSLRLDSVSTALGSGFTHTQEIIIEKAVAGSKATLKETVKKNQGNIAKAAGSVAGGGDKTTMVIGAVSAVSGAANAATAHCEIPMMIINALFSKFTAECDIKEDVSIFFNPSDKFLPPADRKFNEMDRANEWYGKTSVAPDNPVPNIYETISTDPDEAGIKDPRKADADMVTEKRRKVNSTLNSNELKEGPDSRAKKDQLKNRFDKRQQEAKDKLASLSKGDFTPLPSAAVNYLKERQQLRQQLDKEENMTIDFVGGYNPFNASPSYEPGTVGNFTDNVGALVGGAFSAVKEAGSFVKSWLPWHWGDKPEPPAPKYAPGKDGISLSEAMYRLFSGATYVNVLWMLVGRSGEMIVNQLTSGFLSYIPGLSTVGAGIGAVTEGRTRPYCANGCNRKEFLGVWLRHLNVNVTLEPNLQYDHVGCLLYIDLEGPKTWHPYYQPSPSKEPLAPPSKAPLNSEQRVLDLKKEQEEDIERCKALEEHYVEWCISDIKMKDAERRIYDMMSTPFEKGGGGFEAELKTTSKIVLEDKLITTISSTLDNFKKEEVRLEKAIQEAIQEESGLTIKMESARQDIKSASVNVNRLTADLNSKKVLIEKKRERNETKKEKQRLLITTKEGEKQRATDSVGNAKDRLTNTQKNISTTQQNLYAAQRKASAADENVATARNNSNNARNDVISARSNVTNARNEAIVARNKATVAKMKETTVLDKRTKTNQDLDAARNKSDDAKRQRLKRERELSNANATMRAAVRVASAGFIPSEASEAPSASIFEQQMGDILNWHRQNIRKIESEYSRTKSMSDWYKKQIEKKSANLEYIRGYRLNSQEHFNKLYDSLDKHRLEVENNVNHSLIFRRNIKNAISIL